MMQTRFFLAIFIALFLFSCGKNDSSNSENVNDIEEIQKNTLEETAQQFNTEPQSLKYRCDGFYNGITSEWLYVDFNLGDSIITSIKYKNTLEDEWEDCSLSDVKLTNNDGNPVFIGTLGIFESLYDFTFNPNSKEFILNVDERQQLFELETF